MKLRYTVGALLAVASLAILVACGGDDDGGGDGVSGIRTQKGLAVAAIAEGLAAAGGEESDTASVDAAAPAADRQVGGRWSGNRGWLRQLDRPEEAGTLRRRASPATKQRRHHRPGLWLSDGRCRQRYHRAILQPQRSCQRYLPGPSRNPASPAAPSLWHQMSRKSRPSPRPTFSP